MELRISLRKIALLALVALAPLSSSAEGVPQNSVYQLQGKWTTSQGKEIGLGQYRGHYVVVTMAYTRCTYTCPLIVKKLKEIEKSIGPNADVRFLILSFDSKRETPATMRAFKKEKGIEGDRWELATGKTSGTVREMAALLEVNYKEEANGEFSHSNVIALLDKTGAIQASVKGLAADHGPLANFVKKDQ